jgi:hypothetical protein
MRDYLLRLKYRLPYSQGFLLINLIEFVLAMAGCECLLEYIKLCRIPNAKKYSDQIIKLTGLG